MTVLVDVTMTSLGYFGDCFSRSRNEKINRKLFISKLKSRNCNVIGHNISKDATCLGLKPLRFPKRQIFIEMFTEPNAAINVMPEGGTTGWGGDFERSCASHVGNFSKSGTGSLNNVKRVLNAGSLDTNVPPSWKYPEFPEVQTKGI